MIDIGKLLEVVIMAKPGNKNNKARCEKYKAQGRREINKKKKAIKHQKLMEKFAKRKAEGKTYTYTPNPYKKDSKEYIKEQNSRARKNTSHKSDIAQFESVMRKLENELLKQKELSKKEKAG